MKKLAKLAVGILAAVMVGVCLHSQALADGTRGANWSTPTGGSWGTPGTCGSAYQVLQPADSNCNMALSNFMNYNAVTSVVVSTTPIMPLSSYMMIMGTGTSPVTITATPGISTSTVFGGTTPWPDGMELVLVGTSTLGNVITIQDSSLAANSQISTNGAANRVILSSTPVHLIFNATGGNRWAVVGR